MRSTRNKLFAMATATFAAALLQGCGGAEPNLDIGEDLSASALQLKLVFTPEDPQIFGRIAFVWEEDEAATSYRFFEDPDGDSDGDGEPEFEQVGADIPAGTLEAFVDVSVHLYDWARARFMVQSCVNAVCEELGRQKVERLSAAFVRAISGVGANFAFAESGNTLAVGSPATSAFECEEIFPVPLEELDAACEYDETLTQEEVDSLFLTQTEFACEEIFPVPANEIDEFCEYDETLTQEEVDALELTQTFAQAGGVFILQLVDGIWTQEALLSAATKGAGDSLGTAVAISDDGTTLAVSALGEDGGSPGVNGDKENNDENASGAVYIFTRAIVADKPVWTERAYIKASNPEGDPDIGDNLPAGDRFGNALELSGNGRTLAVAAWGEDSNAMLINGDETNNDAPESGAVYIFRNVMGTWSQEAYLKASNAAADDLFGSSISLNEAGDRLAVGAIGESSNATDGPFDNSSDNSGAVYIYDFDGSAWSEQAFIKSASAGTRDEFGFSVALNGAGNMLAVGAPQEDSASIGVGGNENNDSAENSGAAYLFKETAGSWEQKEFFKADNADPVDEAGFDVALNRTGDKLLMTSVREGSAAIGINGSGALDFAVDSGAAYLFVKKDGKWSQRSFIKAALNSTQILFGWDADFAQDGDRLAISAFNTSTVFIF